MTEPVTFAVQRSGRIEVMLGNHLVGVIEPWDSVNIRNSLGRIGAYWWITLPVDGGYSAKHPATSTRKSRRLILHRLAEWFDAAGPMFAPIAETLAAQAELEREAAAS
jgi:hypothetical protein